MWVILVAAWSCFRDGQFEVLDEFTPGAAQFGVLPLDLLEPAGTVAGTGASGPR